MFKQLKCIAFLAIAFAIHGVANASVVVDDFSATASVGSPLSTSFGSISVLQPNSNALITGQNGTGYRVDVSGSGLSGARASLIYNFTSGLSSVASTEPDDIVRIFAPVYSSDGFSLSVSFTDGNGQTYLQGTSEFVGSATLGTPTDPLVLSTGRMLSELTGSADISQIRFDFIYTGGDPQPDNQRINFGGSAGGFLVATPEPTSFLMFGIAAVGLAGRRRRAA